MNSTLRIDVSDDDSIQTVSLSGELDKGSCSQLEACLAEHCRPGARIVLDLRSLNFLDGAGVELLHRAYVRASLEGWAFAVMTPGERFRAPRRAAA